MENHHNGETEKLAAADANVSDLGVSKLSRFEEKPSTRRRRELERQKERENFVAEPTVEISVNQDTDAQYFMPGSFLSCEYVVKLAPDTDLVAIESSVIWVTEGKGEEDIGVHFFERRNRASFTTDTFDRPQRLSTVLPQSPLSYRGRILNVRWQVRVRLFLAGGVDFITDHPFRLGFNENPCRWVETE